MSYVPGSHVRQAYQRALSKKGTDLTDAATMRFFEANVKLALAAEARDNKSLLKLYALELKRQLAHNTAVRDLPQFNGLWDRSHGPAFTPTPPEDDSTGRGRGAGRKTRRRRRKRRSLSLKR